MKNKKTRVLFVCMGNICRSPTAEAVFRRALEQRGLDKNVECDSAGTHGFHIGEPPDERAQRAALRRGYDMSKRRGRKVGGDDFAHFDYIIAMDRHNLESLRRMCPGDFGDKLFLFGDFHPEHAGREVPDPYYGSGQGFEHVLDMIEAINERLVDRLQNLSGA